MNIHLKLNKNTNIFAFNFYIYQLSSIVKVFYFVFQELNRTNKACEITAEITAEIMSRFRSSIELEVFHCFLYEPES